MVGVKEKGKCKGQVLLDIRKSLREKGEKLSSKEMLDLSKLYSKEELDQMLEDLR